MTVAITDPTVPTFTIKESDLKVEWYSGTGSGGQFRNKHQNSARITHVPTGVVCTAQCRSRQNSYDEAMQALTQKVLDMQSKMHYDSVSQNRKQQVGSGMRGDKIRTYRFQDDIVTDHNTGQTNLTSRVMRGYFDLLW